MKRFLPLIIWGVFLIYLGGAVFGAAARSHQGFNLSGFGRLPVMMNGRIQPIDSVARLGLLQIRGTFAVPPDDARAWRWQVWTRPPALDATAWLLELLMKPDAAAARKVFPVADPTVLQTLGLRPIAGGGPTFLAYSDLESKIGEIGKEATRISKIKAESRASAEREWLRLRNALVIYERLKNSVQPNSFLDRKADGKPAAYNFAAKLADYQTDLLKGMAVAGRERDKKPQFDQATEETVRAFAAPYANVARVAMLKIVPPTNIDTGRDRWEDIGTAVLNSARTGQLPPAVGHFAAMSSAVAQDKPAAFNAELTKYGQWLAMRGFGPEVDRARYESFYNRFQPFVRATAIYLVAFVLSVGWIVRRSVVLHRSAAGLVALAYVVHTIGLLFGVMLDGRPPVTNAYSLTLFVGWAAVLVSGAVYRFWGRPVGVAAAALAGLVALISAHRFATGGYFGLVQSALVDGSFWVAAGAAAMCLIAFRSAAMATDHDADLAPGSGTTERPLVHRLKLRTSRGSR